MKAEEWKLNEWIRAQEVVSKGIDITEVNIENNSIKIEAWVKSRSIEGKKYGVLLPLEKDSNKNRYNIRMDCATHHCDEVKFNDIDYCHHVLALAIYVKKHFKEIKKEYKLKGVNLG